MTQMDQKRRTVRNSTEFLDAFWVLSRAAVGVTMVRTREPFRVMEVLRDSAFAQDGMDFKTWNVLYGWTSFNRRDPSAEPQVDNMVEPLSALKAVGGIGGGDGFPNGVFCFMYPHLLNMDKHPGIIHCLKEYAKLFTEGKRRLVLLMPLGYELPRELSDDVVILDFDPPSYSELREIYDQVIADLPVDPAEKPQFTEDEVDRLLSAGAGMVAHEFETAMSRAMVTNRGRLGEVSADDLCSVILRVKTEMVKKSEVLELMHAEDMGNVGGLDNLKEWLEMRKACFSQEARNFGVDVPRGIALIGPPGTGKSLVAKGTAHGLGLPLIRFDVSRVFNSLVGSSEARVRAALSMVDAMAPLVLFIDEADKCFRADAGAGDSGVGQRILGAILTWLQESTSPVFVVVTANRVDNLPAEFLRRGRLDEVFSVQMPSEAERRDVLGIHLRKRNHDPAQIENLGAAVDASAGFVGSEIEAAVNDALIVAFSTEQSVTGELIAEQFGNMKPLSVAFAEQFQRMAEWAENNARPANAGETPSARPVRTRTRAGAGRSSRAVDVLDG